MYIGHGDDSEGCTQEFKVGLGAEDIRTWRVCAYMLEFKSPSSQLGRTDLEPGPESGALLPKSLLLDGESEEWGQGSPRKQEAVRVKNMAVPESMFQEEDGFRRRTLNLQVRLQKHVPI